MGLCTSNYTKPDNSTNILVKNSWDDFKNDILLVNFNDTFFENLKQYTNNKIGINNANIQIRIFVLIITVLLDFNETNRINNIRKIKKIFLEENICDENYEDIQKSLNKTLIKILNDKCNDEVLNAWNKSCKNVCKLVKNNNM